MEILSVLFGMSLAISISGSLALGGLLLVLVVVRAVREKKWGGPVTRLEGAVWGFIFWVTITTLSQRAAGFWEALSWQSAVAVFFLSARLLRPQELKKALEGYAVAAVVAGLWGLIQPMTGFVFDPNIPHLYKPEWALGWPDSIGRYLAVWVERAVGPRSHPLSYAETIMPALLLFFGVFFAGFKRGDDRRKTMWLSISVVLLIGGLVASESRGVWLGAAAGVFILSFLLPLRPRLLLFGGGTLTVMMILAVSPVYRARAFSIVSLRSGRDSDRQSGEIRFQLWRQSLDRIQAKPLAGWGLKKAELYTVDPVFNRPRIWTQTHNIFLQTAMESGLIGLFIFLFIGGRSLTEIFRFPSQDRLLFLALWMAFLVAGLTESWTRDKVVAFLFWGFIGLISRHSGESRNPKVLK